MRLDAAGIEIADNRGDGVFELAPDRGGRVCATAPPPLIGDGRLNGMVGAAVWCVCEPSSGLIGIVASAECGRA